MAGRPLIRAIACQTRLDIDDQAGTRERVLAAAARAAEEGDPVVLPELANVGCVFADAAEAYALAEPLDGPYLRALADISRRSGCVVVTGFAERDGGVTRNSAVVLDRGEVLAVHRKVHLWGLESTCFAPGDQPLPVCDTSVGRVGALVCYDLEFPAYVAHAARRGAQVITAPVGWPLRDSPPPGERPIDTVRVQTMAAINRLFFVVADRCGPERGVDWVEGSMIVGPEGYPLAGPGVPGGEGRVAADLDLAEADDKRLGEHNHVFDDHRPAAYG